MADEPITIIYLICTIVVITGVTAIENAKSDKTVEIAADAIIVATGFMLIATILRFIVYPVIDYDTSTIEPPTVESIPSESSETIIDTQELREEPRENLGNYLGNAYVLTPLDEIPLEDLKLMAYTVQAEAGSQDLYGKRLVADVILNRIDSSEFPDTVSEVIYQHNQFSTASNGAIEKAKATVTGDCYKAIELELLDRTDTSILYFTAGDYNDSGTPAYQYGAHYFSRR